MVFYVGHDATYDEQVLSKYLELKVHHYRRQDKEAKRDLDVENYVTPQWLFDQFGKQCCDCGDCFRFDIKGNTVESNLTADRIDVDECHHLNNVVPLCVSCNQKKSTW